MRFGEYLSGRPVLMISPLLPAELAERINAEADSVFNPIGVGAIGWARLGRLRLRYRDRASYHYRSKPILTGTIRPDPAGTRLDLRYRAPFNIFLGAFVALAVLAFSLLARIDGIMTIFLIVFTVMVGTQSVFIALAMREADADLAALIAFLEETAEARTVEP